MAEYGPRPQEHHESPLSSAGRQGRLILLALAGLLAGMWRAGLIHGIPCYFLHWTGLPCPLCGATRSLASLLEGRLGESISLHLLLPVTFFFFLAQMCTHLTELIASRELAPWSTWNRIWWHVALVWLVYGVSRIVWQLSGL